MAELDELAEPAVRNLLRAEVEQLYEQLGMRTKAIVLDPAGAGSFQLDVLYEGAEMGARDELAELGRRVFRRWNAEAQKLICGEDPEEAADRGKVYAAFGVSETAVAAAMSAFFVAQLGVAPALAAVVAAIVCRRFFRPAYEEFCATWARSLSVERGAPSGRTDPPC